MRESGPPADPESLLVTLDTGERIHLLDWGGPDAELPPLLLLHGLSQTAWSFAPVARRLRARTRVLTPDLRGHGLSEAPRTGYELESLAFDALTVLAANGFGEDAGGPPAVVGGHGLGALVAVATAVLRPSSVAGLALLDAGWEDVGAATGLTPDEFLRGLAEPPEVLRSMAAYLADRRDYDPPSWDADQERAARSAVDEKHAGHVVPVVRQHALRGAVGAMFEYRPRESLAAVRVPVLVAVAESGSADDEEARERRLDLEELLGVRAATDAAPARVIRFGGTGHNVMRYRPEELSAALLELLETAAGAG